MRSFVLLVCFVLVTVGCPSIAQDGYNMAVAAKAFTDSMKAQHPECQAGAVLTSSTLTLCTDLTKAVAAKDALIDAVEVYCAGPGFNGGGVCQPPAKGTPAATQLTAKLQAAMNLYTQTEADLKGAVK